jgi:hypothetical protein
MMSIINTHDNLAVTAISLIILIFFNTEFLLNLATTKLLAHSDCLFNIKIYQL